jgi:hypothetical protein
MEGFLMGISASYWVLCDICGDDAGASRPSQEEAWEYAERGDWWTNRGYGAAVCIGCFDSDVIYHAQYSNTFCVLCQTGEHVAIIK